MNGENIEQQMAFIIDQQARLTVDLAKMLEYVSHITQQIGRLTDALLSLTNIVERHDAQISSNEAQISSNEALIAALAEQGKETDARLNALIEIAEHHISGHN